MTYLYFIVLVWNIMNDKPDINFYLSEVTACEEFSKVQNNYYTESFIFGARESSDGIPQFDNLECVPKVNYGVREISDGK